MLRDSKVLQSAIPTVVEVLEQINKGKGNKKYTNLLKKVHYSQLINMDFKFASKIEYMRVLKKYSNNGRQHDNEQWQVLYTFEVGLA